MLLPHAPRARGFRPHVDLDVQSVDDPARWEPGGGWIVAAGGDVPLRISGGTDFFPKARVLLGSMKNASSEGVGVFGMEFIATLRTSF